MPRAPEFTYVIDLYRDRLNEVIPNAVGRLIEAGEASSRLQGLALAEAAGALVAYARRLDRTRPEAASEARGDAARLLACAQHVLDEPEDARALALLRLLKLRGRAAADFSEELATSAERAAAAVLVVEPLGGAHDLYAQAQLADTAQSLLRTAVTHQYRADRLRAAPPSTPDRAAMRRAMTCRPAPQAIDHGPQVLGEIHPRAVASAARLLGLAVREPVDEPAVDAAPSGSEEVPGL
jgi:hypothetical protein